MSEHIPTTAEIIHAWRFFQTENRAYDGDAEAEVRSWMAAHDTGVRERALREAEDAAADALNTWWLTETTPDEDTSSVMDVRKAVRALRSGVVAEEPERRTLSPDEINALPIGSVVMTETNIESFGVYEQRVWQKFGGEPDWQFGVPRHEWQSTDGGFERVDELDRLRGRFGFNRRVTLLWVPVKQEGAGDE